MRERLALNGLNILASNKFKESQSGFSSFSMMDNGKKIYERGELSTIYKQSRISSRADSKLF